MNTAHPFRTNYASAVARRQSPPTRARDSDRSRARTRLDVAYAEGQLTAESWRDLVARTEAAETLPELAGLVRDLQPPAEPEAGRSEKASGRRIAAVIAGVAVVAVAAVLWAAFPDGDAEPIVDHDTRSSGAGVVLGLL